MGTWLRWELDRIEPSLAAKAANACRNLFARATTLERRL